MQLYPSEVVHVDANEVIWQHFHFGAYPGVDESPPEYIQSCLCSGDRHSKPADQEKKKTIALGSHDTSATVQLYPPHATGIVQRIAFPFENCVLRSD